MLRVIAAGALFIALAAGVSSAPGVSVQDEAAPQGQATTVNCSGAGVTCTVTGGVGTITVPGGAGGGAPASAPYWLQPGLDAGPLPNAKATGKCDAGQVLVAGDICGDTVAKASAALDLDPTCTQCVTAAHMGLNADKVLVGPIDGKQAAEHALPSCPAGGLGWNSDAGTFPCNPIPDVPACDAGCMVISPGVCSCSVSSATSATALAATPQTCDAGGFAVGVGTNGNAVCTNKDLVRLSSPFTTKSNAFVSVSGIARTLAINKSVPVDCFITLQSSTATIGPSFQFSNQRALAASNLEWVEFRTAATATWEASFLPDASGAASTPTTPCTSSCLTTPPQTWRVWGNFTNGGAGTNTIQLQVRSGTAVDAGAIVGITISAVTCKFYE